MIRPSVECGGEIWEGNKGQVAALESILGGAKRQLFSREWETKHCRGKQRRAWGRVVNELSVSLGLDKKMNGWRILRGEKVH